jgi:hypothetical protein
MSTAPADNHLKEITMKLIITLLTLALLSLSNVASASAPAPVLQGGAPLKSAFGATVTGRDFRAEPSESKGGDDSAK